MRRPGTQDIVHQPESYFQEWRGRQDGRSPPDDPKGWAFTGATIVERITHSEASATVRAVMAEADEVAQGLGVRLPFTIDQRMEGAREVGSHKTSMLQDLEAGRPMELESVVGVVIERVDKLGLPMPLTRTLYSCTRLLEQVRGQTQAQIRTTFCLCAMA